MRPTALITGGARRVGAEMVRHLAGNGWRVLVHWNTSREEVEILHQEWPRQIELLQADLATPNGRRDLAAKTFDLLDGQALDLLVHNASIFPHCRLEDADDSLVDKLFALHVKAPLLLTRDLAAPLAQAEGLVLNMLDAGADLHWPGYLPYALSKQSLKDVTLALARQLAPRIRVNGIEPGFILPPEDAPEAYRKAEALRLTTEPGGPQHILRALDYLLDARFVTGEILLVDGGRRWIRPLGGN